MAVMTSQFPTDAAGENFQKVLAALRRIRPEKKGRRFKPLVVRWVEKRMPSDDQAEACANAIIGGYHLLAVEMRHSTMLNVSSEVPRISWSFGEDDEDTEFTVGGAAPSLAIAKERAEQALRVFFGVED